MAEVWENVTDWIGKKLRGDTYGRGRMIDPSNASFWEEYGGVDPKSMRLVGYSPSSVRPQAEYQPQVAPMGVEYASPALAAATPTQAPRNPYEFPAGDKPAVPPEYHSILGKVPNSNVVASVLAQETGGYGYYPAVLEPYQVIDPETGKEDTKYRVLEIVKDWEEARRRGVKGPSGEVGIAQIIPECHLKGSGFKSEEAYADALYDPYFSIAEAGRILNEKFNIYRDWKKALSKWNTGEDYPSEVLGRIGMLD